MNIASVQEGDLLWTPSPEQREASRLTHYLRWLKRERGIDCADYAAAHAFSVRDLPGFWQSVWDYFEVIAHGRASTVLEGAMPHAHWFPGATLNYTENALRRRDAHTALIFRSESGERLELSYAELAERVARARAGLLRLGVGRGDRVAAFAPNRPETLIAFLAAASLGAVFSSCSPEFGVGSVLDRFRQIEPKVLLAVDHYVYGGKRFDRRAELAAIRAGLSSLRAVVLLGEGDESVVSWGELTATNAPLSFEAVPFEHPLWILYSSGTTGLPKPIVHGHGGILLEHLKALALHSDLGEKDRFFWFSTTGWMMWNYLVGGLLLGSTIVLYDGSPAHPDLGALFRMIDEERLTYFGTSAPFLLACQKQGLDPKQHARFDSLRAIGTTGAPLPAQGFAWVYAAIKSDLLLGSVSGGTDVCTAFLLSCPLLPVRAGELQCRGLGAKIEAFDDAGQPVTGVVGELVLTEPMPSMPTRFWNDPDDRRRIDSYFSTYPGVWRHGDWIKLTERGTAVIYGRSDATLNRGGVRMGTSEFYRVVEGLPEIADSLVVDTGGPEDANGSLWLFVVLREGAALDAELTQRLKAAIRSELSPRHVPDQIRKVPVVPRTLNGKKLEIPVKRILLGHDPAKVASKDTLADPMALEPYVAIARTPLTA
ncbi:MAG: acetoacetate--CoA ligase [Myxococcota bacterium]|nr:acetoacetate--CoA ligase [Myxococcota bacterium]